MNIKSLPFFAVLLFFFAACKEDKNKFIVVGDISNMPPQTVLLEELSIKDIKVLDSAKSNDKGHFELTGKGLEPGLYRLHFSGNQFIILSVDKENVKVSASWENLEKYEIKGSASSSSLRDFLFNVRTYLSDFRTMTMVMDSLRMRGNDSMIEVAAREMQEINMKLTRFIEQYSDTTKFLPNALFAVQILNPASEKEYLDIFVQSINSRFPNSQLAKDFIDKYHELSTKAAAATGHLPGPQVGSQAPAIALATPDNVQISLSTFKGKYVLVDFWASWCAPCRKENPYVVAAFQKYKDKNFTVLGVSLDNDREKWIAAIKKDNLSWTHVSDLKGWESIAARDYEVSAIPANFLVDPNGKIIARDLHGTDLEAELESVLK